MSRPQCRHRPQRRPMRPTVLHPTTRRTPAVQPWTAVPISSNRLNPGDRGLFKERKCTCSQHPERFAATALRLGDAARRAGSQHYLRKRVNGELRLFPFQALICDGCGREWSTGLAGAPLGGWTPEEAPEFPPRLK